MTVAAFVTNKNEVETVVRWAARFAAADETNLLVVVPRKTKGKQQWRDIENDGNADENNLAKEVLQLANELDTDQLRVHRSAGSSTDEKAIQCQVLVREIQSPDPESAFVNDMKDMDIRLLLIPGRESTRNADDADNWIYRLLMETPCQTMVVRGGADDFERPVNAVVVTDGDPETDVALDRAQRLIEKFAGELSLVYVRPDDDRLAMQVAKYQLDRLDKNVRVDLSQIPKTIVLQDNLRSAIEKHCGKNHPDLVMVGTRNLRKISSLMRPWGTPDIRSSLVVVRDGVPLSSRLLNEIRLWIRARVPQMNREQRIKLVDRLNLNSNFDFDFVALIVLSTMIAALGLVQNSGAVVIGAMLVAPLMTPLVGIGFSLVQSNERLVKTSVKSVLSGFGVAFAVGLVIGLLLTLGNKTGMLFQGIETANAQLQFRGHPTLLDWFVAFVSGIAAAYAMGRPNLVSALPGVAIAAALVPPIATSGIALSVLDFELSVGALLLFFTNIVAIALGTAVTFWAVGIDSRTEAKKQEGKQAIAWPRYYFLAFVLLSFVLAGAMSWRNRPTRQIDDPITESRRTTD